jgi:CRP-like cAMP-binding protein
MKDIMTDIDPSEYVATLALLKKLDFLEGVNDDSLQGMLFSLQKQTFPKQRTILFQGEIANRLFIVRNGSVIISTKNKGQKLILAELHTPAYFGEISLLRPTGATATVTAGDEGADLLILSHDALNDLTRKMPDVVQRIQAVIEARLASKKQAKDADDN